MTMLACSVTQKTEAEATVSWTVSDAAKLCAVFLDGDCILSTEGSDDLARSVDVPWTQGETHHVEVHELDAGEETGPVSPRPNHFPDLSWTYLEAAVRYRAFLEGAIMGSFAQDDAVGRFTFASPRSVPAGWNMLEVKAIDDYGNESTRDRWPYYVFTPLDAPSGAALSGTSPYTLTITP